MVIIPLFVVRALANGCREALCRFFVRLYAALAIINKLLVMVGHLKASRRCLTFASRKTGLSAYNFAPCMRTVYG